MTIQGVAAQTDQNIGYRAGQRLEVRPFLPSLPPGAKVLEVGCGEGAFSEYLCQHHDVWGIEPFAEAADVARTRLNHVLTGTFEQVADQLPRDYFDVVVCNDVIEHMTDHDAFLRNVQAVMRPGAHIVGSLPNVRFGYNLYELLIGKDWQYQDAGILDRTHFRFFTKRSIIRSLSDAGFAVQTIHGINRITTVPQMLNRAIGRVMRKLRRTAPTSPAPTAAVAAVPPAAPRSLLQKLAPLVFIFGFRFASLGQSEDICYLQFGFRAQRRQG